MATVIKFKGDDIPITIGLTDSDGNDINIDDLAELYVYIIYNQQNTVVKKYSKAGTGDFTKLRRVTLISYIADWLSGDTKIALTGQYDIQINMVETDANYEDSKKNTIGSDIIISLHESNIKNISSG